MQPMIVSSRIAVEYMWTSNGPSHTTDRGNSWEILNILTTLYWKRLSMAARPRFIGNARDRAIAARFLISMHALIMATMPPHFSIPETIMARLQMIIVFARTTE